MTVKFTHVITKEEARSEYVELTDLLGWSRGQRLPPDGSALCIVDGQGRVTSARRVGLDRIGGDITKWFRANQVVAGTVISVHYDPSYIRDGHPTVILRPEQSTSEPVFPSFQASLAPPYRSPAHPTIAEPTITTPATPKSQAITARPPQMGMAWALHLAVVALRSLGGEASETEIKQWIQGNCRDLHVGWQGDVTFALRLNSGGKGNDLFSPVPNAPDRWKLTLMGWQGAEPVERPAAQPDQTQAPIPASDRSENRSPRASSAEPVPRHRSADQSVLEMAVSALQALGGEASEADIRDWVERNGATTWSTRKYFVVYAVRDSADGTGRNLFESVPGMPSRWRLAEGRAGVVSHAGSGQFDRTFQVGKERPSRAAGADKRTLRGSKGAAYEILKSEGRPMSMQQLTAVALERGLLRTHGKTPVSSMGAQLYSDIARHKESSAFALFGKNRFGLREWGGEIIERTRGEGHVDGTEMPTATGTVHRVGQLIKSSRWSTRAENTALECYLLAVMAHELGWYHEALERVDQALDSGLQGAFQAKAERLRSMCVSSTLSSGQGHQSSGDKVL